MIINEIENKIKKLFEEMQDNGGGGWYVGQITAYCDTLNMLQKSHFYFLHWETKKDGTVKYEGVIKKSKSKLQHFQTYFLC